ncbi:unnamed protein product, partial [Mesorhabditis belari]|uniref:MHD domain-containing protein n=1 Tax=Mesorhabditis belari TaxID=2138241 RepID=A0AAF3EET1_9BILA
MTDFLYVNNFWGEKHHGHHVMYENLRHGEETIGEVIQFLKERTQFEDDLQKQLAKNAHKIGSFIAHGSPFMPGWALAKGTIELLAEIHAAFLKSLQELSRELSRYQDEFQKSRKKAKDQDVIDTVNLMQTTTTCLQKAKETYVSRFNELEKLRRDASASAKEINKTESKLLKAKEEYRQYVEKYEQIRVQYERKMENACALFQAMDMDHYSALRQYLLTYSVQQQDTMNAALQVCSQFRESIQAIDVSCFIENFIKKSGTGKDRPQQVTFEDLDGLLVSHLGDDSERSLGTSQPSSSNSSQVVKSDPPPPMPPTAHDLLMLDEVPMNWNEQENKINNQRKAALPQQALPQQALPPLTSLRSDSPSRSEESMDIPPIPQSSHPQTPPFSTSFGGTAGKKLAMWLPKRKKTTSQSSIPDTEETANSMGGFLKFRKGSKKKHSNIDFTGEVPRPENADDALSTASSCRSEEKTLNGGAPNSNHLIVDSDGYTIRPSEQQNDRTKDRPQWSSCSSSDDEDQNEMQKSKIRALTIKPAELGSSQRNASVDELRDAIGSITLGRSSTFDKDPWSTSSHRTPFSQSLGGGMKPLRAAHTGDEHLRNKFNEADFARSNVPLSFSASMGAAPILGMARARPRSNTPTTATLMNKRDSMGSQDWGLHLSAASSELALSSSLSNSTINLMQANISEHRVPVAMAMNEYCHAWYKGADLTSRVVRVFGTVMISFASTSIPTLTDLSNNISALTFRLVSAERIKAVLPNKELLISAGHGNDEHRYSFDRQALSKWLREQQDTKPELPFYNAEVLRYELKENEKIEPPLHLVSFWKTEPETTDIFIDYRLNTECPVSAALLNVSFSTKVNGGVENVITDPSAAWQSDSSTLCWSLTELSREGQLNGSLKARLRLSEGVGPSAPSHTHVNFQCSEASLSGASIQLDVSDTFHLSMIRRKLFAGKYFCEPEIRK